MRFTANTSRRSKGDIYEDVLKRHSHTCRLSQYWYKGADCPGKFCYNTLPEKSREVYKKMRVFEP